MKLYDDFLRDKVVIAQPKGFEVDPAQRAKKGALAALVCIGDQCGEPRHALSMCKRHYKQDAM